MSDLASLLARPETADDPYPAYDLLRETDRVLWVEEMGRWLVTGHREALFLLCHDRVSVNRHLLDDGVPPEQKPRGLPFIDPPDHTRLRALVQQAFTPGAVERIRPEAEKLADELLNAADDRDEVDIITDFAGPLPAITLASMLGIPPEDHDLFRSWAAAIVEAIDPVSHQLVSDAGLQERVSMQDYLTDIIAQRRQRPTEDLISGMVEAEESGDRLTGTELMEMCVVLTIAGVEATTNMIGNGVNALLDHDDQLARLRSEPQMIRTAVGELLRYDAPIQVAGRIPLEDIELDGHRIGEGQSVGVLLGGANRDPEVFPDPGRLDLARSPNNHLAFGRGIHFCLGAPLARVEGSVAISMLVNRFPGLHRAGPGKRRANVHVRGFMSLPVALR
ncbi:MAG: cytochrome P450 [Streptosporangiaceae bacterium]|nr:cytochrome P450 [Streptosporangiaceae bacterium]